MELNKLEQRILESFQETDTFNSGSYEEVARIAAKIALELAWEQYRVGRAEAGMRIIKGFDQFKQEIL